MKAYWGLVMSSFLVLDADIIIDVLASSFVCRCYHHGRKEGVTPAVMAAKSGNTEILQLLIEAGADLNKPSKVR